MTLDQLRRWLPLDAWLGELSPLGRERTRLLLAALGMGVVGGVSAVAFEIGMRGLGLLILGTATPSVGVASPVRAIVGAVVASLVSGVAATMWTSTGRPQGIPDVIQAVRVDNPDFGWKNGVASAVAALFAIGGGQSAGREGPIVQLSATAASELCGRFAVPPRMHRALTAAGAAAAIGASFNSPLGGAFFAMEALLGTFALDAFAPVVVASVTGTVVGQVLLGNRLALQLPPMSLASPWELLVYPVLGVACGIVTVGLRWMLRVAATQLARLPGPPALRTGVSGLFVGALAGLGVSHVMGNGYALMEAMIGGQMRLGLAMLGLVLLAKMVATALAYSGKSGGGIFAPTLFLGAVTGQYVGLVAQAVAPSLAPNPAVFAVVGTGAVCAAVSHTPVTMALMIAEMTGNYAIILPLMLTIAIATAIGNAADRYSVYVQPLLDRGVRLQRRPEELALYDLRVSEVMRRQGYATVEPDTAFDPLAQLFLDHREDHVFVVRDGRLEGVVDLQDMKGLLHDPRKRGGVTAGTLARSAATARARDPLAEVMETFFRTGLEALPVLDDDERLIGVVTERDVIGALNREFLRHDASVASLETSEHADAGALELPEGHSLANLEVGPLAGGTLASLDLQRKLGVTVIAIDAWDVGEERHVRLPVDIGRALAPRDRLVVMGRAEDLERLAHGRSSRDAGGPAA